VSETLVTAERLRSLLEYAPETGLFYWRRTVGAAYAGRPAGASRASSGYPLICIDRRRYYAHRLAWLYVHGRHPQGVIDHINGDLADNRIANLRECSPSENARNMLRSVPSRSGIKGVLRRGNRWRARIHADGRCHWLGSYPTRKQAAAAYDEAAQRLHGEFARPNGISRDGQIELRPAPRGPAFPCKIQPERRRVVSGDGKEVLT
jgi:HNH endonuclease/AP2 domain-containing protein